MKFGILGVFAWIHVALGVIAICAAVGVFLALTFGLWSPAASDPAWFMATRYGVAVVGAVLVIGLSIAAYGQFILLVMKIEENTRNLAASVHDPRWNGNGDSRPVFVTCPRASGEDLS